MPLPIQPLARNRKKRAEKAAKKRLGKPYAFRLDEDQARDLDAKITASGYTPSEFLRDCVLKNQTVVIAKGKPSLEKTRMQFVFNKAGNNLNQIAHVLNSANLTHRLTDALFKDATRALLDISAYLRAALSHVD